MIPPPNAAWPRIRFVLVRTSHPGNIGSAARAIKNMGFHQLDLVSPLKFPSPEAEALASGAGDVLTQARVFSDLPAALSGARVAFGLSARSRSVSVPVLSPREAAAWVLENAQTGGNTPAEYAFLFGSERTGLENEELGLCAMQIMIPTADYSSLNLAMAVQIMAYELRLACTGEKPLPQGSGLYPEDANASAAELESFFGHLEETLRGIQFLPNHADKLLRRLRRLYFKANLERREINILRGILSATQKMIMERDLIKNKEA